MCICIILLVFNVLQVVILNKYNGTNYLAPGGGCEVFYFFAPPAKDSRASNVDSPIVVRRKRELFT